MESKQEAARKMAQYFYLVDEGTVCVFHLVSPTESDSDPFKLLEINRNAVETGRIMPLGFDASPERGDPYPYVIVQVTPEEYQQILAGKLKLPDGWQVGEEIPNTNPELSEEEKAYVPTEQDLQELNDEIDKRIRSLTGDSADDPKAKQCEKELVE